MDRSVLSTLGTLNYKAYQDKDFFRLLIRIKCTSVLNGLNVELRLSASWGVEKSVT